VEIPLAGMARHGTTRAPPQVANADNRRWSLYGAPWLQPVAISGRSDRHGNGENKPKPLPLVATGCREKHMVRRGSTVRVRQRALQKPRTTGLFTSDRFADSRTWGRYGALYGAFRSKTRSWRAALRATARRQRRFGAPQLPRSGCSASRTRPASLTTQPRRAIARRPSVCGRPTA
jgi:hypothetical protein